jgi:hypothetical protein
MTVTDAAVAVFVALLVLGGLYVPRIGDAIGRRLRRDPPAERQAPPRSAPRG